MTDLKHELPDYKDALKNLLTFVTDMAREHPDEVQRERAGTVFVDFFLASLLKGSEAQAKGSAE